MYINSKYYADIERIEEIQPRLHEIIEDIYRDSENKFNILEWMIRDTEHKTKESMYQLLCDMNITNISKEEFMQMLDDKIRSLP